MKQTAVEWLLNAIETKNGKEFSSYYSEFVEQAKEMEKEQMNDTWEDSRLFDKGHEYIGEQKSFEQYYNEIFNIKDK
jgi:hypothetical protein